MLPGRFKGKSVVMPELNEMVLGGFYSKRVDERRWRRLYVLNLERARF